MKKLLYIVPLLLGMLLTSCYDEDIEKINGRLDAIENTQIATISQQITSINNSIQLLTDTDTELKEYIATLGKDAEQFEVDIEALKAKDSAIEKLIAELRSYVDSELKSAQDWASATFATLEQHNALASELASLKTYVEGVENSLNDAISALETSMKKWVNEQLTGYYTIAEIDAKVNALKNNYAEGKADVEQDIAELQTELTNAKSELTKGYQNAITEAINTNNGVINAKIATEISAVNEKIAGLSKRLDEIESRLSAVEDAIEQIKALDIIFGNTDELACHAGASASVDYTIVGGDEQTTIEAFGDGGWSANIVAESATTGKVVVTAPSEISKRGKVIVLATSGLGGVAMKSLYFDEGVLIGILDTYEVDWEACTLKISLKTNLNYIINIPSEAQGWIGLAQTRAAVRNETLTFSISENPEEMIRSVILDVVGECGDVLQSFEIVQKPAPSDGYIEFADKYAKLVCVEKFDINGDGEVSFKEALKVTSLGNNFFGAYNTVVKSFEELQFFKNVKTIDITFGDCNNLTSIILPDSVTTISTGAFRNCRSLAQITIPNSVTYIGTGTFENCSTLKEVTLSNKLKKIENHTFNSCVSLSSINIPLEVTAIGWRAFYNCNGLTDIIINDNITTIDNEAFYQCSGLKSVTIGKNVSSIGWRAFKYCENLETVFCKPITPPSGGDDIFDNNAENRKFFVPREWIDAYKMFANWAKYSNDIVGYEFE